MGFFSGKKLLLVGLALVLLIGIPLTLYLVRQQQITKSGATPTTVLSLVPTPQNTTTGQQVSFDVMMDPGQNQVSFAKLVITYDATKIATAGAGLRPSTNADNGLSTILEGPIYTNGTATITLNAAGDASRAIQKPTKIATITFQANAVTDTTGTKISFGGATQVLSSEKATSNFDENVLSQPIPGVLIITAGTTTPTPTATPTPTVAPTQAAAVAPVCTGLTVDRATTGTAPFTIVFGAAGNTSSGTISKVTFNFGDSQVQDITQTGGIGTPSVNVQQSHVYNNAGTFTATAILTGSGGLTSNPTACSQTITVTTANGGTGTTGGGTVAATQSGQTAQITPKPTRSLPVTGPGEVVVGIGALGAAISVIGAALFLIL